MEVMLLATPFLYFVSIFIEWCVMWYSYAIKVGDGGVAGHTS